MPVVVLAVVAEDAAARAATTVESRHRGELAIFRPRSSPTAPERPAGTGPGTGAAVDRRRRDPPPCRYSPRERRCGSLDLARSRPRRHSPRGCASRPPWWHGAPRRGPLERAEACADGTWSCRRAAFGCSLPPRSDGFSCPPFPVACAPGIGPASSDRLFLQSWLARKRSWGVGRNLVGSDAGRREKRASVERRVRVIGISLDLDGTSR